MKAFVQVSSKTVDEEDAEDEIRDRFASAMRGLSDKFHSFALMQLANRARQDPFAKIKGMIGDMIFDVFQIEAFTALVCR